MAIVKSDQLGKGSNPIKGAKFRDHAVEFSKQWAIGSKLTWEEFSNWAQEQGLLDSVPEEGSDKQSDEWLAYLQRRHQVRMNINKAAEHSDMIGRGGAYSVVASGGALLVKSAASALATAKSADRIAQLATTKRKQLEHLYQSTDWSQIPSHEMAMAEGLMIDLTNWIEVINLQAKQHETKFSLLQGKIRKLVENGTLLPSSDEISGFIGCDVSN